MKKLSLSTNNKVITFYPSIHLMQRVCNVFLLIDAIAASIIWSIHLGHCNNRSLLPALLFSAVFGAIYVILLRVIVDNHTQPAKAHSLNALHQKGTLVWPRIPSIWWSIRFINEMTHLLSENNPKKCLNTMFVAIATNVTPTTSLAPLFLSLFRI